MGFSEVLDSCNAVIDFIKHEIGTQYALFVGLSVGVSVTFVNTA